MSKKLLIVDDEPNLRDILREYLETEGYSVGEADSGAAGLSAFAALQPDVVISDIAMPKMNGFELCRQLRSQPGNEFVPFIFLSAFGEIDDRLRGYQLGADDYLVKPISLVELGAKVEMLLHRSYRLQREMLRLLQGVSSLSPEAAPQADSPPLPLTEAETRVFLEVAKGFSNKAIGDRLFISHRTVQAHVTNILRKLELKTRSQLIHLAAERGLLQDE